MIENSEDNDELKFVFYSIAAALGCKTPSEAVDLLKGINRELFVKENIETHQDDVTLLAGSVNVTRLKNNPVQLSEDTLATLYSKILEELKFSDVNKSIGQKILDFIDMCFSNYTPPPEAILFRNIEKK